MGVEFALVFIHHNYGRVALGRRTYIYDRATLSHRTTLPLTKQMDLFLRDLSERCKEDCGRWIDKTQLLRALISVLMKVGDKLDFTSVEDEGDLVECLRRALSKK